MENLRFEESFKDAFSGAEIAPSGVVWTNVELGLEKSSGGKLKGRILFFQLLAAASMVFAMGVGSVYFLEPTSEPSHSLSESTSALQPEKMKPAGDLTTNNLNKIDQNAIQKSQDRSNKKQLTGTEDNQFSKVIVDEQSVNENDNNLFSKSRLLPSLVAVEKPTLKIPTQEADAGMLLLAKLNDEEKQIQKQKPTLKEKLWASLGFGAGSYNPNANGSLDKSMGLSGTGSSLSGQPLSDPTSGTSYSVGVSVGGKISKRVVLQGGISYLTQNSTYTSNTVNSGGAYLNDYASLSRAEDLQSKDQITVTNPYQVNNNLQYMSIPVQAGYIIVDRDFGLQVNAGISTDIFFQNTLTPEGSDLNEVSHGPGDDSPYRTLNFSGLLGTELSYKLSDHYRVAINPGVRYALNSIYKSEVSADVSPVTFDVALRFRYMF